jgi:hypothetical protein
MKNIDYWEALILKLETEFVLRTSVFEGEVKGRPNVKGLSREVRSKLISAYEKRSRQDRINAKRVAKLPLRIMYAKDRIAALRKITVFDHLRNGGLPI